MDDLISRNALLAEYDRVHVGPPGGARKLMEAAPAVDAVEVVRCGECEKFRRHTFVNTQFGTCSIGYVTKHECGFCDSGERKENESHKL